MCRLPRLWLTSLLSCIVPQRSFRQWFMVTFFNALYTYVFQTDVHTCVASVCFLVFVDKNHRPFSLLSITLSLKSSSCAMLSVASYHPTDPTNHIVTFFVTLSPCITLSVFTARCTFIGITCRLSVCLCVTLVDCDQIGWNSSEIIPPLVSLRCSLSADLNIRGLLQGEHAEILAQSDQPRVDLRVGDIRSQIAAEWLQTAQRSQWRAYIGNHHCSFEWCHRWPLRPPLPPKWGFHMSQDTRMAISPQRVIRYTSRLVLG